MKFLAAAFEKLRVSIRSQNTFSDSMCIISPYYLVHRCHSLLITHQESWVGPFLVAPQLRFVRFTPQGYCRIYSLVFLSRSNEFIRWSSVLVVTNLFVGLPFS